MPRKDIKPGSLTVRHVLVVITGILVCFAPATLTLNTWSILIVPVCTGLDVSTNAFTLYASAIFATMAVTALFAGKLMERFDLRIVLTVSCVLCTGGVFLCSFYTEVWQFYVSGILEGLGALVLMSLAAPTLINRWFHVHMGLLIGICVACTGVGAAVWNMLGGVLLSSFDWRMCFMAFGLIGAVLSIPPCMFFIRSYPKDAGLRPFGMREAADDHEDEAQAITEDHSIPAKKAFRMPAFALLCITIALTNGTAQLGNYLATYMYHLSDIGAMGVTAAMAVIMASIITACLQIAQAGGKILLGQIADHTLRAALITSFTCGLLGVLFVWQGPAFGTPVVYSGAVLFGVFFATTNVLGPTITRYLFGSKDYTPIYSRASVFINLSPAIFIQVYALLSDTSWDLLFGFVVVIVCVIAFCAFMLIHQITRIQKQAKSYEDNAA